MRLTNVETRQRRLLLIVLTVARREHRIDPCGYLSRIASTRLSSSTASSSRPILCNTFASAASESAKNDEYRSPQARSLISSERLRSGSASAYRSEERRVGREVKSRG